VGQAQHRDQRDEVDQRIENADVKELRPPEEEPGDGNELIARMRS
jgi:hypothetical protein